MVNVRRQVLFRNCRWAILKLPSSRGNWENPTQTEKTEKKSKCCCWTEDVSKQICCGALCACGYLYTPSRQQSVFAALEPCSAQQNHRDALLSWPDPCHCQPSARRPETSGGWNSWIVSPLPLLHTCTLPSTKEENVRLPLSFHAACFSVRKTVPWWFAMRAKIMDSVHPQGMGGVWRKAKKPPVCVGRCSSLRWWPSSLTSPRVLSPFLVAGLLPLGVMHPSSLVALPPESSLQEPPLTRRLFFPATFPPGHKECKLNYITDNVI